MSVTAALFSFPPAKAPSQAGLFLLDRKTPGLAISAETELTADVTVGKLVTSASFKRALVMISGARDRRLR
jgi:hypothetical protein